jgi:hypothetical protein
MAATTRSGASMTSKWVIRLISQRRMPVTSLSI